MEKEQKITLARIAVSALLLIISLLPVGQIAKLILCLAAFLAVGGTVLWEAMEGILHGEFFDENFLMSVASIGAILLGEYYEAVAVMLFFAVGELFEDVAVERSREAITALMDIRPDYANMERDGELCRVSPSEVACGSVIVVRAGERIPLDGVVVEGSSTLDTSALTGESMPRDVSVGENVISGCVNLTGLLRIRTTGDFAESTVSKILDLVENAEDGKARSQAFITRFAKLYTPFVVLGAVLLALIPSLITGDWLLWVRRALIFLVASCPCALVVSIPLSFFGGIGAASRVGVLVKGSGVLEALAKPSVVVFDKTGTLTGGKFGVTGVYPTGELSERELLCVAALAESYSTHPIARSVCDCYGAELDRSRVGEVEELSGYGIRSRVDGRAVLVGNLALMEKDAISIGEKIDGTVVYVSIDGEYAGCIVLEDEIKEGAAETIRTLRALGVRKSVMLTGDRQEVGERVACALGIDEVHGGLLPEGKVERVEALLAEKGERGTLVFVGDGVNDAPVLARADIGVAMGAFGSDAAAMAADVVLMDDKPAALVSAVRVARKTRRVVLENIVFALSVKALALLLGALGVTGMWFAVFADVGVMVLAVLNSLRAARVKR